MSSQHDPDDEAALRSSYEGMAPEHQRRFRALGAFPPPEADYATWAVAAVWGDEADQAAAFLDTLAARSLVVRAPDGRWQQPAAVHDYALVLLRHEGEEQAARRAHAEAFARYAEQHWNWNEGPMLEREYDNLKAAFAWARAAPDADLLYRLACNTRYLTLASGRWGEGREWLEAALGALGDAQDDETRSRRAKLQSASGDLAYNRGDYPEATRMFEDAAKTMQALGDRKQAAALQGKLADLAMRHGDTAEAERLFTSAIDTMQALGERQQVAAMQGALADLAMMRGEYDEAERLYNESMKTTQELNERRTVAVLQGKLADLAMQRGDYAEAERLFTSGIDTMKVLGDRQQAAAMQGALADVAMRRGDTAEAERLCKEWLTAMQELGDRREVAVAQGKLADLAMQRGDTAEVERLNREYLKTAQEIGDKREAAVAQAKLADLAIRRGDYDEAERLFRRALETLKSLGDLQGVALSQAHLARVLIATNRKDEGCALFEQAAKTLREIGDAQADAVEADWHKHCGGSDAPAPPTDPFDVIANYTIAVLTTASEQREAWFKNVRKVRAQAAQHNDAPMVALLDAVTKLLLGDDPADIAPQLEGPYKACWERIVAGVGKGQAD